MSVSGDTGDFTLQANAEKRIILGPSNYFYLYDATGLVVVELWDGKKFIEAHTMGRLALLPGKQYDTVVIRDASGNANTVRAFYGPGNYSPAVDRANIDIEDGTSVDIGNQPTVTVDDGTPVRVNMVNGSITVSNTLPNQVTPLPDVSVGVAATLVAAADAESLEYVVTIKPDAPNGVRWGNGGVTATKGAYIGPGETRVISIENANLYMIRDGASDVDVTLTLLERV